MTHHEQYLFLAVLALVFLGGIYIVLRECRASLMEINDTLDLIRSAAEGIERNVGVIAQPISARRGKRFSRWLRTNWPMMLMELKKAFRKPRRTMADPPTTEETGVNL